jgi:hypothetical protein
MTKLQATGERLVVYRDTQPVILEPSADGAYLIVTHVPEPTGPDEPLRARAERFTIGIEDLVLVIRTHGTPVPEGGG